MKQVISNLKLATFDRKSDSAGEGSKGEGRNLRMMGSYLRAGMNFYYSHQKRLSPLNMRQLENQVKNIFYKRLYQLNIY